MTARKHYMNLSLGQEYADSAAKLAKNANFEKTPEFLRKLLVQLEAITEGKAWDVRQLQLK